MVKLLSDSHPLNHTWAQTVEGAIHKYPNDHNTSVRSIDILNRSIDENGNLITEKLITSKFDVNKAMTSVLNKLGLPIKEQQKTMEISTLNLSNKFYLMKTHNITYFGSIDLYENLLYLPGQGNTTVLKQSTEVNMYAQNYNSLWRWVINLGEGILHSSIGTNVSKGRIGLESVINQLKQDIANSVNDFKNPEEIIAKAVKSAENLFNSLKDTSLQTVENFPKLNQETCDQILGVNCETCKQIDQYITSGKLKIEQLVKEIDELDTDLKLKEACEMYKEFENDIRNIMESTKNDIENCKRLGFEKIEKIIKGEEMAE